MGFATVVVGFGCLGQRRRCRSVGRHDDAALLAGFGDVALLAGFGDATTLVGFDAVMLVGFVDDVGRWHWWRM